VLGRGFLLGIAVGIGIGLYAGPLLGKAGVRLIDDEKSLSMMGNLQKLTPETWPTNQNAKEELFRFSNWDHVGYGGASKVTVNRCRQISDQSIACELSAALSWIQDQKALEAVFNGTPDNWLMVAVKTP